MIIKKFLGYTAAACLLMSLSNAFGADTNNTTTLKLADQAVKPVFNKTGKAFVAPTIDVTAHSYVLMDYNSGQIIAEKNKDERVAPASLTKMMTMYIVSTALKSGQLTLDSKVHITKKAWKTGGSRMFVKVGSDVPVHDLLKGIIVASGNDACVALATHVAGSEAAFATLMNQTAQDLGMKNSHFVDSTGLPNDDHYTTAHDIAILTHALIRDFPEFYAWYKQKWFVYNDIKQPNRNRLLWRDATVDGVKTGHTDKAGYCLASSAKRDNTRIISVVMGASADATRASDSESLLNYGFRFFESHKLFTAGQSLSEPRIWSGEQKTLQVGLTKDLFVSIPMGQYQTLKADLTLNKDIKAPITKGQQLGEVKIMLNDQVLATRPIVAFQDNLQGGLWARTRDHVVRMFNKWL